MTQPTPAAFALLALTSWALASALGCSRSGESDLAAAARPATEAPQPPAARIVSLAPSHTELLFALGAGDAVIGVTRFCDEPAAARALPKVGGYVDPSFEAIVALSPDVVVSEGGPASAPMLERLERAGVRVARVPIATLSDVTPGVRALGAAIGRADAAEALARRLAGQLDALRPTAEAAAGPPLRALVVYGARPLVVAGPGTFAHDLLSLLGAENAAAEAAVAYPSWSLEQLVRAAPDVLFDARMDGDEAPGPWEGVTEIPAVRRGRVLRLQSTAALRPGPRLPEAATALRDALREASAR